MKPEIYSDYVSYEIDKYYYQHPYGPDRCPMCAGDLTSSETEPSSAMYDMLWDPIREKYRLYVSSRASLLYTCNKCCWWCIREACECIDSPEHPIRFYFDYLVFAVIEKGGVEVSKDIPEVSQPWLKALDDPDIYDSDVVRDLPNELATLIYRQSDAPESSSTRPRVIRDLSRYDPFLDKMRNLIAKKRERKSRKTEPMQLQPGDRVRVIEQTFGHFEKRSYIIAIAQGNLGTVVSYNYFLRSHGYVVSEASRQEGDGVHYPIRLETAIPPPEDECAYLETLHKRPYRHGIEYNAGYIWLMDVNCLEKIT
jgi:hypothetical protein